MNPPITRSDALQMLRRRLKWLEDRLADSARCPTVRGRLMLEKEAAALRFALAELGGLRETRQAS